MTTIEKLQTDLDDARRQVRLSPTRNERKFWKQRVHDITEDLLEAKGLVTRTYQERYGTDFHDIQE